MYYDPKKDIIIASDTGNLGLGAVILHKERNGQVKMIVYASRILLPAEKGYSQIEKETLGIIFAVKTSTDSFMEEVLCSKWITYSYCLFLPPQKN